jgi:hypothetical protein
MNDDVSSQLNSSPLFYVLKAPMKETMEEEEEIACV